MMNPYIRKAGLVAALFLLTITAYGQKKFATYEAYIEQYSDLARAHQSQYGIPASITIAQGLLESGAGKSELAVKSNNHFGIKCHSNWEGNRTFHADDGPNDCFRVYKTVDESYEDHSRFLAERKRYQELFTYDVKDYKKWAKGLQKCGYATDKGYANKLIKIIEDYELYRFDSGIGKGKKGESNFVNPANDGPTEIFTSSDPQPREILKRQNLRYILVQEGDYIGKIARDTGVKTKDLLKYNEIPENFPLREGDLIYLQKKKAKADKPYFDHEVEVGESLHSIAQKYGIRLKSLYKLNKLSPDYVPEEGDVLRLR